MPRIYDPPVIRTAFLIALRLPVYAPDFAAEGIDQGLRLIACDIDVVGCDPGLAIVGELPPDNLARCIVDIGCRLDDRWGFAAEFECHRGQVLCNRERVVSGKRVSVRVDLGGRRIIKKKENETED